MSQANSISIENVPHLIKSKKLAKAESVAAGFKRIMVMKWRDKTEV
jgi:hypothetical protein